MRIYTENTESFINALANSINKDPASLETWRCLHVEHTDSSLADSRKVILKQLKETHTDLDCEVVQCNDNDILFISRSMKDDELWAVANEFVNAASLEENKSSEFAFYDLFSDWRIVREILISKTGGENLTRPQPSLHNFGEISTMKELFLEAKKLRKARYPIHIMVVEDDPLTRRIITNSFKDNYAIISVASGEEAVANYMLHAPDIVFLDIGLPDANGFDVLHYIMSSDPDAYVVMFSANSYLDNVTTALLNGASGFVSKPFKKEKMRTYIQNSALHHNKQIASGGSI